MRHKLYRVSTTYVVSYTVGIFRKKKLRDEIDSNHPTYVFAVDAQAAERWVEKNVPIPD